MTNLITSDPQTFALFAIALLVAITVHEFAHAWMAVKLGDPTPKLQGRLTLNPLSHLDPIGTLMLLLVSFGWGKPVQFDPFNLENPRRDSALISLAGPFSNILLATVFSLIFRIALFTGVGVQLAASVIPFMIHMNVLLAVFNLLPIHPLDGGKILVGILPESEAAQVDLFLRKYGMIILIMLLVFPAFGGFSPITLVMRPIISFLVSIYLPGIALI